MKKIGLLLFSLISFLSERTLNGQTTVFSDDFSTNTNAAYTTTGAIGASPWMVLVQNADWGARRNTSPEQLELTNDASAAANAIGWVLASVASSSFPAPYNTTLNLNTGTVTWNFNMRQIRTDPAGMGAGSYGAAFILAGTANTTRSTGNGFAITYGQSGTTDPVRLVEYTAGLGTSTNIITSNTAGLTDFGAEYLSVRVTYTPSTNTWELFLRNDGAAAFADPTTAGLVSQGTAIYSTNTNVPLPLMGAFWNGSTAAAQTAFFDNVSVTVANAAPASVSIGGSADAFEGGATGSFTITFTPATTAPATINYNFPPAGVQSATFGTDYTASIVSSPTAGATPAALAASSGTITVPAGVNTVTVTITTVDDVLAEGLEDIEMHISVPSAPYVLGTAIGHINLIDNEATKISSIQGPGSSALPSFYTIEAIVTGVYPTLNPAGFYIQEEDADADANVNTSEGIFVVSAAAVNPGDLVRVTGPVIEGPAAPSFNQAVITGNTVTVLSSGNPLPTPVMINLPVTAIADYEKYEGMRVTFPQTLTVTNNENLGAFGEVNLSAGGLVYQPTQVIDPNDNPPSGTSSSGTTNVAAITALTSSNTLRTILLDDGRGTIPTLPYVDANNTLRVGSTIANITGILGYAFSQYRIQPLNGPLPVFTHAARPGVPSVGAGNLKILSFNVLNYFNGDGAGGGFPTSRGASSLAEFNRQRDKIINAITTVNPDLIGVLEMENQDLNTAVPALQDLVNGLNAIAGPGTYAFIDDDLDNNGVQDNNTDLIRTAIIYKPSVLAPVGNAMLGNDPSNDRPPLAQTFNFIANNKKFNFIVNHLKAKSCSGASGADLDQGDGQACYNNRRKLQANALLNFMNTVVIPTSGTNRIITVGDYNSYYEEDPIDILRAAGYVTPGAATEYSYLFGGMLGSLDHIIVSPSLAGWVTGIAKWNTNSVEPDYLSYEDAINDGGGDVVNPWAATYTVSPWRASDHDAVILGINIDVALPVNLLDFVAVKQNFSGKLSWTTTSESNSSFFVVERYGNSSIWEMIATIPAAGNSNSPRDYSFLDVRPAKGINYYRLKMVSVDGEVSYSDVRIINFSNKYNYTLYPNPAVNTMRLYTDDGRGLNGSIQVLNNTGQLVFEKRVVPGSPSVEINISGLAKGVYFLRVGENGAAWSQIKFVKE
jgi:predicted extracellular nuclease